MYPNQICLNLDTLRVFLRRERSVVWTTFVFGGLKRTGDFRLVIVAPFSRLQPGGTHRTVPNMSRQLPLLVFSDLDGTLLCHDTYSWDAARPALTALAGIGAGVVLASSKTAAEIAPIREAMGLQDWPALVENGAGVLAAGKPARSEATEYSNIRAVLRKIDSDLRSTFRGFGDMTVAQVVEVTGLSKPDAALAKTRSFTEPGLWSGTETGKEAFLNALSQYRVFAREGGRFLTLSFGQTKADRMADIIAALEPRHTMALGDAPNDVEMLQAADFGVIVGNPHRAPLPSLTNEQTGQIIRTTLPGPEGWNAAVLELIARLDLN